MRVMLRLFNSLEVVNQCPAYSNPLSDTQIFYALRFDVPPHHTSSNYTVLYQDEQGDMHTDNIEDMDDDISLYGLECNKLRLLGDTIEEICR
jgi:hypothetical protein